MADLTTVSFRLNRQAVSVQVDPTTPSVYVLRNDLGINGVRFGCGQGSCGVCMILVDGRPERSCEVAIDGLQGRDVTTVEGIGTEDDPHPVQQAILDEQAAQCGYCLTGIIITAAALPPGSSEETIREQLSNHLCRCGTHSRILRAVITANARMAAAE